MSLKYLSNFRKILEIYLIICGINIVLTWSANCVIKFSTDHQPAIFTITDTELCVSVVTLSIENNAKLPQQLNSGFHRTNNWNKYQSKTTMEGKNNIFLFN